jgi:hypothetical protein
MGWDSIRNGELLALVATDFDVMVTVDHGIEHEQNQGTLPLAIVLVHAPTNDIDDLPPKMPVVAAALSTLRLKTLVHVHQEGPNFGFAPRLLRLLSSSFYYVCAHRNRIRSGRDPAGDGL